MSGSENFLERWSRRKREAAEEEPAPAPKPKSHDTKAESETEAKPNVASRLGEPNIAAADKPFDIASLPSIDSITASTDVRAFMQAGVPPDLTRAALRRAWSTDPQIRDFVGLVENGWDFNDPNAMHGFGPIEPSEVARLMGNFAMTPPPEPEKTADTHDGEPPRSAANAEQRAASPEPAAPVAEPRPQQMVQRNKDDAASQNESNESAPPAGPKSRDQN